MPTQPSDSLLLAEMELAREDDDIDIERLVTSPPKNEQQPRTKIEAMIANALEKQCRQLIMPKLRQCVKEEMARATQVLGAQRPRSITPQSYGDNLQPPLTPMQPGHERIPSKHLSRVAEGAEDEPHAWSRRHVRTNTVTSFLGDMGTSIQSLGMQVTPPTPKTAHSVLGPPGHSASSSRATSKAAAWERDNAVVAVRDERDITQSITSAVTFVRPRGDGDCGEFDVQGLAAQLELVGQVESDRHNTDVEAFGRHVSKKGTERSNRSARSDVLKTVVPTPDEGESGSAADEPERDINRSSTRTTRDYFLQKLGTAAGAKTMKRLLGMDAIPRDSSSGLSAGSESCFHKLRRFILSERFDSIVGVIILLNAAFLGLQAHYIVKDKVPPVLRYIEIMFMIVMTLEVILRLWVHRLTYLIGRGWPGNWLDMVIVLITLFEEVGKAIQLEHAPSGSNITFLRVLRIARMVRMIRLVHVLRLISELHTLVRSIAGSMKSLGWTVALFFLMVYTLSVFVTQLVADKVTTAREVPSEDLSETSRNLVRFYGSLAGTMLSLFQAVTGGLDWNDILEPLMEEISPWCAILLVTYVGFATFAMLNVVTGIFVESVVKSTKADKDLFLISNARSLFESLEGGLHSHMTWELFESKLECQEMHEFFEAIDVDRSEAKGLFFLLDLDQSGAISAEEFLNGCIRLRGPAKALDLALLVQEVHGMNRRLFKTYRLLEAHTAALQQLVPTESLSMSNVLRSETANLELFA
eukprot:TRINITY_DN5986_c0_g1_i1.p1 TRINITY_DN5986_c0_g1~~TRINITY_DN5986_c0_g1_i1.p1  ORF type:complete len:754 (-),score=142.23 TRINITY_DN5986_c0_g1_i1:35-2296(-)